MWAVPLEESARNELRARLVDKGVPVRFLDEDGSTVNLVTGEKQGRYINNIFKTTYWDFDRETIKLIEANTGLRAYLLG